MSWEAFRLTSKSPAELLTTLGPHGVDHLIRTALDTLWREHPAETRSIETVTADARNVFDRNLKVWSAIKKPTPEAFFANLLPHAADGHVRQAFVLCWMMLPRAGGREFADVRKIVTAIFERDLADWATDNATFTGKKRRAASTVKKKITTKAQRHKGHKGKK